MRCRERHNGAIQSVTLALLISSFSFFLGAHFRVHEGRKMLDPDWLTVSPSTRLCLFAPSFASHLPPARPQEPAQFPKRRKRRPPPSPRRGELCLPTVRPPWLSPPPCRICNKFFSAILLLNKTSTSLSVLSTHRCLSPPFESRTGQVQRMKLSTITPAVALVALASAARRVDAVRHTQTQSQSHKITIANNTNIKSEPNLLV